MLINVQMAMLLNRVESALLLEYDLFCILDHEAVPKIWTHWWIVMDDF